jgi:flagellum-specific peptidoglycan hydrolase FlgJ
MSERNTSVLDAFPDEFLAANDPELSPLDSGARDIKRVATGTTLEVIGDTATEALQNPRVASGVAAGTLLFSTLSSAASPVLAAAQSFASRGAAIHQKDRATQSSGDRLDEVSFILQPGGAIYPLAVREAPVMGVSVDEAIAESEVASGIDPSEVTDLPVGTEVDFPLHYKFALMPEGRDLDWIAAQHTMTLEQLLRMNPAYRTDPNAVQAGATLLVNALTQTTLTPVPAYRPHQERHRAITPTRRAEAPAPKLEKPAAPVVHLKVAPVVAPKAHIWVQPHRPFPMIPKTVTPQKEIPQKPQAKRAQATHPKVHIASGPAFGADLHLDLGQAFSTAGTLSAETPDLLAQNTLGHVAAVTHTIVKSLASPAGSEHVAHTTHTAPAPARVSPAVSAEKEPTAAGTKYDIYSSVLNKSGISAAALQYALSQMEGGDMADLAGPIHQVEQKYGINALYVAAAGCIESACGTSNFARERNNDFGIEAYTDNPDDASTFPSQSANVTAFAQLLHDNYLHPGAQYWGGSGSLHSIYKNYSTSHDSEARSIAEVMNTLAAHAHYYDAMHGSADSSTTTTPISHPRHKHGSHHKTSTKNHAKSHNSSPSTITSIYKALAHAWENPLG